jgi:hypothetical protein
MADGGGEPQAFYEAYATLSAALRRSEAHMKKGARFS